MREKSWLLRAAGSTGPSFRSPHRATFPWDRLPSPGQGTSYAANLDQLHEKETAEKSLVFQGWAGHAGEGGRQREVGRQAAGLRSVPAGEPGVYFSSALHLPPHLSILALCRGLSLLPHFPQGLLREAHGGGPTACPPTATPSLPSLVATPQGGCSFSPNPHPSGESKDGLLGKSRKNEKGPAMQNEQDSECKEWMGPFRREKTQRCDA